MRGWTSAAKFRCHGASVWGVFFAVELAAAVILRPAPILAEPHVRGTPQAVSVDAQNTSIDEILQALGKAFDVRYRSSVKLERQLSGTYKGSLQRVLARVLEGYDFIAITNNGKIEVAVVGTRYPAGTVAPAAPTASTAGPNSLAQSPVASTASSSVERPAAVTPTPKMRSPGVKAEGPMPPDVLSTLQSTSSVGPVMRPSTVMPPLPSSESSVGPEVRPSTVMPPLPSSASSVGPEVRPSTIMPPLPGEGQQR